MQNIIIVKCQTKCGVSSYSVCVYTEHVFYPKGVYIVTELVQVQFGLSCSLLQQTNLKLI